MRRLEAGESNTGGGIGLFGAIFVVFLALKLAEVGVVADWSWWWVTAPLWGPFLLLAAFAVLAGIVWLGGVALTTFADRRGAKRHDSILRRLR